MTVTYNPQMPPETFDLVIVDEAHRSIFDLWRGVLAGVPHFSVSVWPPTSGGY